ncbi:MAG: Transglycosylase-associated protein [Hyphomicrobiales bacterium]|jgi:uncharacterized membrane protein YeaQ/YmgE (transglycosylase-associated protein family)|nr:Transglycosylase-associated protein [Hyphomicrobiales bacterium]
MDQPLALLGTPGVGFFTLLFIGAIAGWIAERVTKSDHGLLTNIIVGVAGSFVASSLAEALNISVRGFLGHLVAAAVGAILVLWVWRQVRGRDGAPPAER